MFYKFPKAVIDNVRRSYAYRQLDECAPLAFNYRSILSVQSHWSSVRPSVGRSVGPHVRYFERNNIGYDWPVRGAQARTFSGPPNIYGGQSQISGVPRAPFD